MKGISRLGLLLVPVVFTAGCLVPGTQYLNPPGFSSTYHRIQMQQQHGVMPAGHVVLEPHPVAPILTDE